MIPRILALVLTFCALATSAVAGREVETARVAALGEDQTVRLASGENARFGDVVFPDATLAAPWFASHLLQQEIDYRDIGQDRYGRTLIVAADLQEQMLKDGIAILYPQVHVRPSWLEAEEAARKAKRGVWAVPGFVLTPDNAAQHMLEFHVVEGTITHIHAAKSATYLNFGERWQTDFSATVTGRARRGFADILEQLTPGSIVRLRGTIYEENGPMIRLTRPEQLEIVKLAPAAPAASTATQPAMPATDNAIKNNPAMQFLPSEPSGEPRSGGSLRVIPSSGAQRSHSS